MVSGVGCFRRVQGLRFSVQVQGLGLGFPQDLEIKVLVQRIFSIRVLRSWFKV